MFTGKLYLIPVPIGNLKDITIRALDMLADVDYILAEDTRISKVLLSAYEIDTQLISYHQHNERSRVAQIVEYLDKGKNLGLITDAGMPCISDPGAIIVAELIALDYEVVALPGANAALTCLAASGLNTDKFVFIGFLPIKGKSRKDLLTSISKLANTFIVYEAPHRLTKTLLDLIKWGLEKRKIAIGRELTKKYETYFYGTVQEAYEFYQVEKPRGEFVFVVEGKAEYEKRANVKDEEKDLLIEAVKIDIKELLAGGMQTKSIVDYLARKYDINKNKLYQMALDLAVED